MSLLSVRALMRVSVPTYSSPFLLGLLLGSHKDFGEVPCQAQAAQQEAFQQAH